MTATDALADRLTGVQLRVVQLSLGYATDAQIGAVLGVSIHTVTYHKRQVRGRLPECQSWREVLRHAQAEGMEPETIT